MADITSSTYPVVTDSKDGDQFRVTVEGDGTSDDVTALSGQIVIGS